jgi:hypothetical protein
VADQDAAAVKYERLAVDGDGDTWAYRNSRWRCLSTSGEADDDAELAGQYPPVTFYAPVSPADDHGRRLRCVWCGIELAWIDAAPIQYARNPDVSDEENMRCADQTACQERQDEAAAAAPEPVTETGEQ